ncbi:hypothetical protein [Microbacterium sp. STN6]
MWADQDVVAFLDAHPHSGGHALVIPHIAWCQRVLSDET